MKQNTKKRGFTLVELLIVIAILAILATVTIIGYTSFIEKARVSNDSALVSQLNTVLQANEVTDGKNKTYSDALKDTSANGYSVEKLTPTSSGEIVWDQTNDRFALIDQTGKIVASDASTTVSFGKALWKIAATEADFADAIDENAEFSYYLTEEALKGVAEDKIETIDDESVATITTYTGLDIPSGENVKITYVGSGEANFHVDSELSQVIVENVDAIANVYGSGAQLTVTKAAATSVHIYGQFTTVFVKSGRVVFEAGSDVEVVVPQPKDSTTENEPIAIIAFSEALSASDMPKVRPQAATDTTGYNFTVQTTTSDTGNTSAAKTYTVSLSKGANTIAAASDTADIGTLPSDISEAVAQDENILDSGVAENSEFESGIGTEESPFVIANIGQWLKFRTSNAQTSTIANGIKYSDITWSDKGYYWSVVCDLDFDKITDKVDVSIFSGVIDFNGHKVSGLNWNNCTRCRTSKSNYGGFFNFVYAPATIKNLDFTFEKLYEAKDKLLGNNGNGDASIRVCYKITSQSQSFKFKDTQYEEDTTGFIDGCEADKKGSAKLLSTVSLENITTRGDVYYNDTYESVMAYEVGTNNNYFSGNENTKGGWYFVLKLTNCNNYANITNTDPASVGGVFIGKVYCARVIEFDGCINYGTIKDSHSTGSLLIGKLNSATSGSIEEITVKNCGNEGYIFLAQSSYTYYLIASQNRNGIASVSGTAKDQTITDNVYAYSISGGAIAVDSSNKISLKSGGTEYNNALNTSSTSYTYNITINWMHKFSSGSTTTYSTTLVDCQNLTIKADDKELGLEDFDFDYSNLVLSSGKTQVTFGGKEVTGEGGGKTWGLYYIDGKFMLGFENGSILGKDDIIQIVIEVLSDSNTVAIFESTYTA